MLHELGNCQYFGLSISLKIYFLLAFLPQHEGLLLALLALSRCAGLPSPTRAAGPSFPHPWLQLPRGPSISAPTAKKPDLSSDSFQATAVNFCRFLRRQWRLVAVWSNVSGMLPLHFSCALPRFLSLGRPSLTSSAKPGLLLLKHCFLHKTPSSYGAISITNSVYKSYKRRDPFMSAVSSRFLW